MDYKKNILWIIFPWSETKNNTNLNVQCDINNNWYFWKKHLTTYLFHNYFLHIYVANYDFFNLISMHMSHQTLLCVL